MPLEYCTRIFGSDEPVREHATLASVEFMGLASRTAGLLPLDVEGWLSVAWDPV